MIPRAQEAEELGEAGMVDESMRLMQEAENLKKLAAIPALVPKKQPAPAADVVR